jgi:hypothetical protein
MPSHDSEEFGGELYHDIVARLERSWGIWLDALVRADDRGESVQAKATELMTDTARDDEASLEEIRELLEGSTYETVAASSSVDQADSFARARQTMDHHHDRLLGAIEAASQASNEILEGVRERIGGLTWEQYEERTARLTDSSDQ